MQGRKLGMYISNVRPSTLVSYKNSVNRHIVPRLGGYKLCELKPHLIQRFIKEQENHPDDLCPKMIKNIHDITVYYTLKSIDKIKAFLKNTYSSNISFNSFIDETLINATFRTSFYYDNNFTLARDFRFAYAGLPSAAVPGYPVDRLSIQYAAHTGDCD